MNETTFPRRDRDGRVLRLTELLASVAAGLVLGLVVLVVVDGLTAVFGFGRFGEISGWLAGVLPVWLFVEEYKAWRAVPTRIVLALVAVVFATPMALAAAAAVQNVLPPLGSGTVGIALGALVYAVLWYVGIRRLAERAERGVSR
jgi:ABC-type phosphate transport system permease subunit